jgi:tRNA threonylcarbamoyl adenosine modification protein YeaZ
VTTPYSDLSESRAPIAGADSDNSVVLGIDTATDVRAGVARDGAVVASDVMPDRRAHAEQLLPLVQRVLAAAGATASDITGVVVGVGPGPFTGLRVGVAAAITLAEALGVPVRGVCSLDVVALAWADRGDAPADGFVVAADARRKEVYWAAYDSAAIRPGATLTGRECAGPDGIDAGLMAALGDRLVDAGLEPLYLRRPDAEVPTTRKSTLLQPRLAMMVKP